MTKPTLHRELTVETRVLDGNAGVVEYVASDQSIDSYGEIIRADGWRFDQFARNSPFLDSHRRESIEDVLGKVVDFRVEGTRLVETVQWAIDVPSNQRARIGFEMTRAGYCKAVSVGFIAMRMVTKWDTDKKAWLQQLQALGRSEEDGVRAVYLEQQQLELSAVVIGANPAALATCARAYKAGVLNDQDLQILSGDLAQRRQPASDATAPGHASIEAIARGRQRTRFIEAIREQIARGA